MKIMEISTIVVKTIEPQKLEHFDPDGNSLGFLNEYESTDLRVQIARNEAIGYYIKFDDFLATIQSNGKIVEWPTGMYDALESSTADLFKAQFEILKIQAPKPKIETWESAEIDADNFADMVSPISSGGDAAEYGDWWRSKLDYIKERYNLLKK